MFVGVDNDFRAALPLASPRLKILMAPHWCCRVTPGQGTRGVGILGKLLISRNLGAKVQGDLGEVLNGD